MVSPMRWARLVAVVWAAGLAAWPARAADAEAAPSTTYALSWVRAEGAEDCPTGRALAAEVERRLGRKVFDAAAERSLEVEVTRFGSRYHSDMFVRDGAGKALGHRTLESDEPGCAALFAATALAIALVIDPEAAQRESSVTQGVAAFEAPPPAPPPVAVAPPPPLVVTPPSSAPAAPPPAPALATTPVTMSVRGVLTSGLVPGLAPGFGLSATARPTPRWGYSLSGSYTAPRTVREGVGVFEIGLTRATAALTFDAAQSQALRLSLSAGPSLGAYHLAVLEPVPVTNPGDFLFAALELGATLQVTVSNGLFFELAGQGLVPFKRQEFLTRRQDEPVWSQPWLSGGGLLGVGARFP
jgi:hypothetical protein